MPTAKPIEIITVVAIIMGPVLALFAQRVLDHLREKKKQRLNLFMGLISTRAEFLSRAHVRGLNSIVVVFNKGSDQKIREAWRRVLEHAGTPTTTPDGSSATSISRWICFRPWVLRSDTRSRPTT